MIPSKIRRKNNNIKIEELLINASSAFKLEFNFRLKRLQLMTKEQKYCLETLIGNAGNWNRYSCPTVQDNVIKMNTLIITVYTQAFL